MTSCIVAIDKQSAFLARDAAIAGELKKHASAFFGREMAVRFVDGNEAKTDTIDDYMKEAETVFGSGGISGFTKGGNDVKGFRADPQPGEKDAGAVPEAPGRDGDERSSRGSRAAAWSPAW